MVELLTLLLGLGLFLSVIIFLGLFLGQTLLVTFPTYVLMFYAGMRFGIFWGTILNILGMMLTTIFGYQLGKLGKMDKVMAHPAMEKFTSQVEERGIMAIAFLRVIPILPYNVTSIGSGMLKLDFRKYSIVNFIGVFPYTIIWALLGDFFGDVLLSRISLELSWSLVIPSVIFFSAIILGVRYLKRKYSDEVIEVAEELESTV